MRHLYLIGYDISQPARLSRMMDIVKGMSLGGQKSFYECWLTEGELKQLLKQVVHTLDGEDDSFLLVRLDPRRKSRGLGVAVAARRQSFFLEV